MVYQCVSVITYESRAYGQTQAKEGGRNQVFVSDRSLTELN